MRLSDDFESNFAIGLVGGMVVLVLLAALLCGAYQFGYAEGKSDTLERVHRQCKGCKP